MGTGRHAFATLRCLWRSFEPGRAASPPGSSLDEAKRRETSEVFDPSLLGKTALESQSCQTSLVLQSLWERPKSSSSSLMLRAWQKSPQSDDGTDSDIDKLQKASALHNSRMIIMLMVSNGKRMSYPEARSTQPYLKDRLYPHVHIPHGVSGSGFPWGLFFKTWSARAVLGHRLVEGMNG